jgi:hypothetical protein
VDVGQADVAQHVGTARSRVAAVVVLNRLLPTASPYLLTITGRVSIVRFS